MAHQFVQAPVKRPRSPSRLMAGEAMPAYGVAHGVNGLRIGLRARDRAVIERALSILGAYMRTGGSVFDSPSTVGDYLRLQLDGETAEHFCVLYLDSRHRGIAFERHFSGTLDKTAVYPREIVLAALQHGAACVVLAHNHPSGNVNPSQADEALTQTIKAALAFVDVRVLDHVIVGGGATLSMAECGLI